MSNVVYIDNLSNVTDFLSLSNKVYFDIFLSKNKVRFITNVPEVFSILELKAKCDDAISFRLERSLFTRLITTGRIEIINNTDSVTLIFYNAEGLQLYELQCLKQETYSGDYAHKIELLQALDQNMFFDVSDLRTLCNLAKNNKSIISVNNGVASIHVNGSGRLFQPMHIDKYFAVSADKLALLLKISNRVFSVQDYLGVMSGNFVLLVKKCIGYSNDEFSILNEQKAAYICDLDLANIRSLLSKIQIKSENICLDFNRREISMDYAKSKLKVPLYLKNERKAETYSLETIDFPVNVICNYLCKLNSSIVLFKKKKNFIQLEINGLYFFL